MKRISIIILLFLISPYIYAQSKDEIICLESEIHSDGNIFNLKIKENYLFINDINVIKIYDLNSIKMPILLDTLSINCYDFEIVSDYAFCLNISNRVQIFDISDCKNFNLISEIDFPTQGIPIGIKVIANTILILEESKSFGAGYEYYYYITIINIDNIENPKVVDRKSLNYIPAYDYFFGIFISLSDYT